MGTSAEKRRREGVARGSFRVFGRVARSGVVSAAGRPLLELASRSESLFRQRIALMGWTIPLCRWPFPRLCGLSVDGRTYHHSATSPILSSSSALPLECSSTRPSRPSTRSRRSCSQLLSWTFRSLAHGSFAGQRFAGFACPLRSDFRVS